MSSDAIVDGRKVFQSHVFTLLCKLCFIPLMVCIGSGRLGGWIFQFTYKTHGT